MGGSEFLKISKILKYLEVLKVLKILKNFRKNSKNGLFFLNGKNSTSWKCLNRIFFKFKT